MTDDQRLSERTDERVADGPLMDLHDQLVEAIARQQSTVTPLPSQRRRTGAHTRRQVLAAAAAVVVMIGVALFVTSTNDDARVAADVTVEQDADGVTVSIENSVSVEELERELTAAGVDVDVRPMATGPSRVDHFVSISGNSGKLIGGDGTTTNKAQFTKGDEVVLFLGVAAGQRPYDAMTDAWAYGESLAGTNLDGTTLAESREEIDRRAAASGTSVSYRLLASGQETTPQPEDVIADATGLSANSAVIMLDR